MVVYIILLGLIVGSFIGAYTYRYERGISIAKGRSFCPRCKKQISWYDNIPLLSFVLLNGKCRSCGKKISKRYPLIEFSSVTLYLFIYLFSPQLIININWLSHLPYFLSLLILLAVSSLMLAIFVTDIEKQIIPDEVIFLGVSITMLGILLSNQEIFFSNLLSGLVASLFLLLIFLLTLGRGMGLGDVKLAIFMGLFLGAAGTVVSLFLSFVIGAAIGLFLIGINKAQFGKHIAFGPFLVVSFFIAMLYGRELVAAMFPYII